MKHKVCLFLFAAFMSAANLLQAQTASAVYDPKAPITWLGMDFTLAKFVGDAEKFNQANKSKNLLLAWNELVLKEADKFNIRAAFNKKNVVNDFTSTRRHNEGLDFSSMLVSAPDHELDQSAIRAVVGNYDYFGLNGLGVMLNVESFDRNTNLGTCWITFVNLASRQVIFTERRTGRPKGIGIRNYWAGSIAEILERTGKREIEKWRKKYPNDYTEPAYDGPVLAKVSRVAATAESSSLKKVEAPDKAIKPGGKYYALLIGISKYTDARLNLDQPVADARKIKEVLTQGYDFNAENTILLENPSRGEIFSALYKLRDQVTPSDNLLIFYAGHGFWDEKIKQGYWWPRDANSSDPSNWLSNSDLREQLRGISSAHTLLVSDACFSGGIFRTRDAGSIKSASLDYQMLYKMPSRRAITSGTMTAVPDRSVFVEYFMKRLVQNQEKFLPSQMLFNSIRLAIINNSATVPQEGVIAETGDEGGDFIFQKIMRKN